MPLMKNINDPRQEDKEREKQKKKYVSKEQCVCDTPWITNAEYMQQICTRCGKEIFKAINYQEWWFNFKKY